MDFYLIFCCLLHTALTLTMEEIALLKMFSTFFIADNTVINITYRDHLLRFNVPYRYDKLSPPSEHSYTIRPAAMINQIRRTIEASAAPDQCLLADSESIDLEQAVDMHYQSKIFN
jgi:hypothetical protein